MTAHVSGVPVEETLGMIGPVLLVAFGAAVASFRRLLERTLRGHRGDRLAHARHGHDPR
jgi:hypothetical protein